MWSIGLYPILFVTDNNWEYFGNICQHMQKKMKKMQWLKEQKFIKKIILRKSEKACFFEAFN